MVSGNIVRGIMLAACERGLNFTALCHESGITFDSFEDQSRIPAAKVSALLDIIVSKTGDSTFGLRIGGSAKIAAAGLIGNIVSNCKDFEAAIIQMGKFSNLVADGISFRLHKNGNVCELKVEATKVWKMDYPHACKQLIEMLIAFVYQEIKLLSSMNPISNVQINLEGEGKSNAEAYTNIFQGKLKLGQRVNSLVFSKTFLKTPIHSGNYDTLLTLERYARLLLGEDQSAKFSHVVRRVIINLLTAASPRIDEVASSLNMSQRTLQRRLNEENVTYSMLLDGVKQDLAKRYVNDKSLSLSQIAFMLGYAEQSVFSRRFKKWTGKSPFVFRSMNNSN